MRRTEHEILLSGTRLRWSLTRTTSQSFQLGCTAAFTLLFGGAAYPILRYARAHPETPNVFVMHAVGGAFALVALLLLLVALHQLVSRVTNRMTTVEVDTDQLTPGEDVQFFFRQPGPASFESLRANLIGEETWWEGAGKRRHHKSASLGTWHFFDSGAFEVGRFAPFEQMALLRVPADIPVSGEHEGRTRSWKIEIWGKVRAGADFHHSFPILVGR